MRRTHDPDDFSRYAPPSAGAGGPAPRRRATDAFATRAAALYSKWHPFLVLAALAFAAIGFRVRTPTQRVDEVERVLNQRVDSLRSEFLPVARSVTRTSELLEAMTRLQCVQSRADQLRLAGVPCGETRASSRGEPAR